MTTKPFEFLPFDAAEYLKDEESIAAFLNASLEMDDSAVLLNALSTVARAKSMTALAEASGLGRESLYKALRPGAQPRYDTVVRVMEALGVEMVFQAKRQAAAVPKQGAGVVANRVTKEPVKLAGAKKPARRTRSKEVPATASDRRTRGPASTRGAGRV